MQETAASAEYAKFFLHYNFPPFSTGEVKMMRGVGRREVGHGNLAMRSLKQMLPDSIWYRDWETDRKSTRLNSSHSAKSRMPSSA